MSIVLKPEQENFIQEKLRSGKYTTVDEVILEAFRLLEERDAQENTFTNFSNATSISQTDVVRLEELRQKVRLGSEQIAKGQVTDGEVVFAKLQEKIRREFESQ